MIEDGGVIRVLLVMLVLVVSAFLVVPKQPSGGGGGECRIGADGVGVDRDGACCGTGDY